MVPEVPKPKLIPQPKQIIDVKAQAPQPLTN